MSRLTGKLDKLKQTGYPSFQCAPVAQLDRALAYEAGGSRRSIGTIRHEGIMSPCRGQEFESLRALHMFRILVTTNESDLAVRLWRCDSLRLGFLEWRGVGMRIGMIDRQAIGQRWASVGSKLDERGRRMFAAGEVRTAGWGGLAAVSQITGLARSTIGRGQKDLDGAPLPKGRVRRRVAGAAVCRAGRDADRGSEQRHRARHAGRSDAARCCGCRRARTSWPRVAEMGHAISASSVKRLLPTLGFSRQSNRKADEGSKHPDRNAQFEHINAKAIAAQAAGQPVISVDTKKKELVGNYKNGGTDYRPKGDPRRVNVHDFEDKELGKVVPYGVYDVGGQCRLGQRRDHERHGRVRRRLDPPLARRAWDASATRKPRELTITADCGGSNGARVRLWKVELQKLADETGLVLHVHHYPPGTSKWNKIEHRLFCHITQNWRGRPLSIASPWSS